LRNQDSSDEVSDELQPIAHPQTLATAIKIGAPVSWKKALGAVRESGGRVLTVSEQEIADAKAIIGRDGVGCEPASATTVAGIKRMVAEGIISRDDDVVAVLTGHLLKDTEYVIRYHQQELYIPDGDKGELLKGTYSNQPVRVKATTTAILEGIRRHEAS
jgi:threonine synthase